MTHALGILDSHDERHAWDIGYHYATRGIIIRTAPPETWLVDFAEDFLAGYEQAKLDGRWGSNRGLTRR